MHIIDQEVKVLYPADADQAIQELKMIEYAGRNCYRSQGRITEKSYETFINDLIRHGHTAPLEFGKITVEFITSRAVLAEITRHRMASFCVQSQRYVNDSRTGDISFIIPSWVKEITGTSGIDDWQAYLKKYEDTDGDEIKVCEWINNMHVNECAYKALIKNKCTPQEAREVLPNSTACIIVMTANIREWLHILELRDSKAAYPQMRELASKLREEFVKLYGHLFERNEK